MAIGIEYLLTIQDNAAPGLQAAQRNLETFARDATSRLREVERATSSIGSSVQTTQGTLATFARAAASGVSEVGRASAAAAGQVENAAGSTIRFDRSMRQAGAGVRVLVTPLVSELSPALGSTTMRMASMVSSAALMPTAFAAVGVAAVGLAGLLGGRLLESWQKNRDAAESYRRALDSLDATVVTTELGKVTKAADEAYQKFVTLRQEQQQVRDAPPIYGGPAAGPGQVGRQAIAESAQERARAAAIAREDEKEQLRAQIKALKDAGEEAKALALSEQLAAKVSGDAWAARRKAAEEYAATVKRLREEDRAARYRDAASAAGDESLAFGSAADPFYLSQQADIAKRVAEDLATARLNARREMDLLLAGEDESRAFGNVRDPAFLERLQQISQRTQYERLAARRDVDLAMAGEDESRAFGPVDAAFRQRLQDIQDRGNAENLAAARELLAVEQDRLAILDRIPGLSEAERASLEITLSLKRESLRVSELELLIESEKHPMLREALENRKALVQEEEALLRIYTARAQAERDDPILGLAAGFRDVANELEQTGTIYRQFAVDTSRTMAQAFSDNFFAVVTGDFKSLPDIAKQAGLGILRSITDALGQQVTAPIARAIANAFGAASPYAAGGAGVVPFGSAPSALPGLVNVSGASPAQLASMQTQGVEVVQGPGGQSYAVPTGGFMSGAGAYSTGPGGFWTQPMLPQRTTSYDIGSIYSGSLGSFYGTNPNVSPYGMVSPELTQSAYALRDVTGGPTYGQAAGYAASAAAIAALVYANTQRKTEPDAASSIGMLIGGVATGNPILIAGFAASLIDTGGSQRRRARLKARRSAAAAGIFSELSDAVNAMFQPSDLAARRVSGTENTAGGLLAMLAAMNVAGDLSGSPVSWAPSESAQEALALLLGAGIKPEDLRRSSRLEVGPNTAEDEMSVNLRAVDGGIAALVQFLPDANGVLEDLMRGILDRAERSQQLFEQTPISTAEAYGGVGRVSEFSLSGALRYYPEATGPTFRVLSQEALRNRLGATDEEIAYLWNELRRVKQAKDLQEFDEPNFLGLSA